MNNLPVQKNNIPALVQSAWEGLSPLTQKSYKTDIEIFYSVINKSPEKITPADIVQYVNILRDKGYKNRTINRKIASISKMFKILTAAGQVKNNPVETARTFSKLNFKSVDRKKDTVSIKELKSALRYKTNDKALMKAKALASLLAQTGLRISEMLNIKIDNITPHQNNVSRILVVGKGSKERTIYLPDEFIEKLKKDFNCSEYLVCNESGKSMSRQYAYKIIRQLFQQAINKHVNPHLLRHFYATHKISREKKDIKAVSKYLGHSDVAITLNMYVDTSLDDAEAGIKL